MIGRPSIFTQELADTICRRLAEGESLRNVCRSDDMPDRQTVFRWVRNDSVFRGQYAQALEDRAESYMDEIVDIADDACNDHIQDDKGNLIVNTEAIARSRLRVDTRKWIVCKMMPRKYGLQHIRDGEQGPGVTDPDPDL